MTAFDQSGDMVHLARQRLGPAAALRRHDLDDPLDWLPDATMDLAVMALVIHYVHDHNTHRAAHADHNLLKAIAAGEHSLDAFGWICLDLPTLIVDTTVGYEPSLPDIVAFATAPTATIR